LLPKGAEHGFDEAPKLLEVRSGIEGTAVIEDTKFGTDITACDIAELSKLLVLLFPYLKLWLLPPLQILQ
jgi:hypothetical protein